MFLLMVFMVLRSIFKMITIKPDSIEFTIHMLYFEIKRSVCVFYKN